MFALVLDAAEFAARRCLLDCKQASNCQSECCAFITPQLNDCVKGYSQARSSRSVLDGLPFSRDCCAEAAKRRADPALTALRMLRLNFSMR